MANVIKLKRGSGSDPSASDLVVGEVAIRTDSGKLFTKKDNGTIAEISGSGGGSDIFINTLSSSSGSGGGSATFNGTATRFTLSNPPSVSAQQLLVSINGVVQKPNSGTSPSEGFAIDGNDIIFAAAPAAGSDFFIVTYGSLNIAVPADNSVTSAKIVDGTIVGTDLATNVDLVDNQKIRFGTGNDLEIYHTGSHTIVKNSTGDLRLQSDRIELLNNASSEFYLTGTVNGSVALYYDNGKKFETTSAGAKWTGDLTCDDNNKIRIGSSGDLNLFHNASNSVIENTTGYLKLQSDVFALQNQAGDHDYISVPTVNTGPRLHYDNAVMLDVKSWGVEINGDLGLDDNRKVALGNGPDLLVWHDGSTSLIQSASHPLAYYSNTRHHFLNGDGSENMAVFVANGACELYHDGSKKFETTSTGVKVSGTNLNMNSTYIDFSGSISTPSTAAAIYRPADNTLAFSTANTERFRIDSAGDVEIMQAKKLRWVFAAGSTHRCSIGGEASDSFIIRNGSSDTLRLTIDSSGNIGAPSGTNIYNASDSRLKKNVVDLDKGLSAIKSLRPVSFNWIDGFCDDEKNTLYGFIAQEVQTVDANLVQDFSESSLTIEEQVIDNPLRVNEKLIIPMLVKAVQELEAKVKTLEAN